jgi:TonB family protein
VGYGPGSGAGTGGGVYKIGGGVSSPVPIFKPEPEYSEEARKAKYQGSVTLAIVIMPDGSTSNIRVIRPLGLGLDEKAIEAVTKWRFRPSLKDGKAVAVSANVEVNFRLL